MIKIRDLRHAFGIDWLREIETDRSPESGVGLYRRSGWFKDHEFRLYTVFDVYDSYASTAPQGVLLVDPLHHGKIYDVTWSSRDELMRSRGKPS